MKDDKIVEHLDRIEARLYADQPDVMSPLVDLLELLKTVFCEHEWTGHTGPNTPDGPGESEAWCKKCGLGKDD